MNYRPITDDDISADLAPRWEEGRFDAAYWMDDILEALRRANALARAVKAYQGCTTQDEASGKAYEMAVALTDYEGLK